MPDIKTQQTKVVLDKEFSRVEDQDPKPFKHQKIVSDFMDGKYSRDQNQPIKRLRTD